ncbi:MAG: hypothetical protein LBH26_01215, partial [Treponema sp.]|nr:hypothetical protein [Treponema sp.]
RGESNACLMGCPEEFLKPYPGDRYIQQLPTKQDLDFIEYIKAQPLIKAVFAGHMHYYHESPLTSGVMQYVAGSHFEGDAIEIEVV